jgi:hypothetical protein
MSKPVQILKYLFLLALIAAITGCASARQNPWHKKRVKASRVNTSQLGRNKYYFSPSYQKRLLRSHKKK